jgi:hypothetical protein
MSIEVVEALKVGPSRFSRGGSVRFARYRETGGVAIQVWGDEGLEYTATVALVNAPSPGKHGVWLKDWSENEGVPEALEAAGIIELTGLTASAGFAAAKHALLTERVRQHISKD